MACKIASSSQVAAQITWNSVDPSTEGRAAAASHGGATDSELSRRLAELEQLRHSEIAQAQRVAFEEGVKRAREEAAGEVRASGERLAQNLKELGLLKKRIRNEAEV